MAFWSPLLTNSLELKWKELPESYNYPLYFGKCFWLLYSEFLKEIVNVVNETSCTCNRPTNVLKWDRGLTAYETDSSAGSVKIIMNAEMNSDDLTGVLGVVFERCI